MKKIPLSGKAGKNLFALVDNEDYNHLVQYKWYARTSKKNIYVERQEYLGIIEGKRKSKSIKMHREILGILNSNLQTDHINHDTLDNRRTNLRTCTASQNNHNKSSMARSKSGYKNISKIKNRWRVIVNYRHKSHWVGLYSTLEEAITARDNFRKTLLGEFA